MQSMTRKDLARFTVVATCAILLFLAMSQFLVLPMPRRGMQGAGLYDFVDEIRFHELFWLTLACTFAATRVLRLTTAAGWLLAFACAVLDIALLIVDVRRHAYSDFVEGLIAERYGSPVAVWTWSGCLFGVALVSAVLAWKVENGDLGRNQALGANQATT